MKYEIELWSRSNKLVADISRIAKDRSWSRERNEAESLTFSVDLEALESLAAAAGESALAILEPYAMQFRLKRNGAYLFGGEIASTNTTLESNGGKIDVKCWGYLNMFKDRFISNTYSQWYTGDIMWDILNTVQSITNGSNGITRNLAARASGVLRDRTYERVNVKDALQAFTTLSDSTIDFAFSYDKQFSTYAEIGSLRNDLSFSYPQNITSLTVPREATTLYNRIFGLGSGFGDDQLSSLQEDSTSESIYGVREKVQIYNSVINQDELSENTRNFLASTKSILEIPQMNVRGADIDLNSIIPGDRVPVKVANHKFLSSVNGTYRIERLEVAVDDNDEEQARVYFDNFGL